MKLNSFRKKLQELMKFMVMILKMYFIIINAFMLILNLKYEDMLDQYLENKNNGVYMM